MSSAHGERPRVDYSLSGHIHGDVVYRVPVEVKKLMSIAFRPTGSVHGVPGWKWPVCCPTHMCRLSH